MATIKSSRLSNGSSLTLSLLLYDIPYQIPYLKELRKASPRPKIVMYSPVESGPIVPEKERRASY